MQFDALLVSLFSPMVLLFVLGIIASLIKSDLKFPDELYIALTMYLLVAIGLKGGYKLSLTTFQEFWKPGLAAVALGAAIPAWSFFILQKLGRFDTVDAGAIAAHYGSVSAVTFSAALAYHENLNLPFEGYMPTLLTIMEVPGVLVGLLLAKMQMKNAASARREEGLGEVMRELLSGKSMVLLVGCLAVGVVAGKEGWMQVAPFFDAPFRGILALFLLEAGLVTGRRFGDLRKTGPFLFVFAIVMPVVHAVLGIYLGYFAGLTMGGATILGVLAASASYIAAPAAVRVALPKANPTLYLTASLVITFPFNIVVGIPLYHAIASFVYGG